MAVDADFRTRLRALADLLARTRPRDATGGIALDGSAVVTLGRGSRASVPIDCPIASALHASLSLDDGRVVVRDLGSMSGTFVDGRRIDRPVAIEPGAVVQIADHRYRLAADARTLEPLDARGDTIETVAAAVAIAGGKRILEDVSLVIEPGELVAVMGPRARARARSSRSSTARRPRRPGGCSSAASISTTTSSCSGAGSASCHRTTSSTPISPSGRRSGMRHACGCLATQVPPRSPAGSRR